MSTFAYDPNTASPRPSRRSLGGASAATAGPAFGGGANGLNAGSSSEANGLYVAALAAGAKGFNAGSSSSPPNGLADRLGAAGAGAAPSSHEARAAFEPRSASSQ